VHRVSDVKRTEIQTAEPLVPELSPFEAEITVVKTKKYKSPGSDQISKELIQPGGETLLSVIHEIINSVGKGRIA
jgi:hypothetical protein